MGLGRWRQRERAQTTGFAVVWALGTFYFILSLFVLTNNLQVLYILIDWVWVGGDNENGPKRWFCVVWILSTFFYILSCFFILTNNVTCLGYIYNLHHDVGWLGGDGENGPKRWQDRRLGPRYIFLSRFFCTN
jgi:hypothetical protein